MFLKNFEKFSHRLFENNLNIEATDICKQIFQFHKSFKKSARK
jgi:hypothetical protein